MCECIRLTLTCFLFVDQRSRYIFVSTMRREYVCLCIWCCFELYIYVILNVYGLLIISAIRLNVIILQYLIQRWSKFTHTYALYILRICVQINKNNSIKLKALYGDTTCRLYTIHFVTLVVANTIRYWWNFPKNLPPKPKTNKLFPNFIFQIFCCSYLDMFSYMYLFV